MKLKYEKIKINKGMSLLEVVISTMIFLCLMGIASQIMYHSLKISKEESGLSFIRKEAVKGITWFSKDLRRTHGASLSDCNTFYVIIYKYIYQKHGASLSDCNTPVPNVSKAISFLTTLRSGTTGSQPNSHIASPQWEAYVIYYLESDPRTPREVKNSTQPYYYLLKRAISSPVTNNTLKAGDYVAVFDPNAYGFEIPLAVNDLARILDKTDDPTMEPHVVARNIYDVSVEMPDVEPSCCELRIETRYKSPRGGENGGELKAVETLNIFMRNTIMKIK